MRVKYLINCPWNLPLRRKNVKSLAGRDCWMIMKEFLTCTIYFCNRRTGDLLPGVLCRFVRTDLGIHGKPGTGDQYWIGFVYTALLFMMFLQKNLYTNMLLQPISLAINIYGLYRWTKPRKDEKNTRNQLQITFKQQAAP